MTIYLSDHATFNSTQELNYNVSQHEQANHEKLTASNRTVLRFIARYSVKYAGASHLKASTIAEGTEKSERTVRRILSKLEALNIIERVTFTRPKSGGTGANIIVIQPFLSERVADRQAAENPRHASDEGGNSRKEPSSKREIQNYTNETGTAMLRHAIPKRLYDVMAPFFEGDVEGLYNAIGTLYKSKASVDPSILCEEHSDYTGAFMNVMRRFKEGYIRNLNGYLYSTWQAVTSTISRREARRESRGSTSGLSDWFAQELSREISQEVAEGIAT
ncbi:hypothetical protein CKW00_07045 [Salimicrobium humidisoli]|uniref:Helix-turn-helix domain-containing protein n=2 Tax=Salimicrobium humidisoli TaxID=2029857 RepID=A0ABX4HRN9_9BACI|nr:hypothetical protein CKW00_07045 [Salimicrobium humidisoli]